MDDINLDDLPWDKIVEINEKGIFEEAFKKIPKTRFKFAANNANKEALISSALKSLRKRNPQTSYEQAESLAKLMQTFARKMLEG